LQIVILNRILTQAEARTSAAPERGCLKRRRTIVISLYYAPPSIYGRKVLAVLEEKGLDYQIKPLSFAERDMDKPDYLRLNPNGEVPTLVDENFVVYESTTII